MLQRTSCTQYNRLKSEKKTKRSTVCSLAGIFADIFRRVGRQEPSELPPYTTHSSLHTTDKHITCFWPAVGYHWTRCTGQRLWSYIGRNDVNFFPLFIFMNSGSLMAAMIAAVSQWAQRVHWAGCDWREAFGCQDL